jgi:hypothetical protein
MKISIRKEVEQAQQNDTDNKLLKNAFFSAGSALIYEFSWFGSPVNSGFSI